MSHSASQLLVFATNFEKLTSESLVKSAKKKEDSEKDSKKDGKKPAKGKFPFWLKKKKTPDTNSASDSKDSKKSAPKSKEVKKDKKKKKSAYYETLLNKLAQTPGSPAFLGPSFQPVDHIDHPVSMTGHAEPSKAAPAPAAGWTGPRIDPVFQTMLSLSPDGKLGPMTQQALNVYKKSVNQPTMSNELAYEYLKAEPEYASKTKMEHDDNANVFVSSRQKATPTFAPAPDPGF